MKKEGTFYDVTRNKYKDMKSIAYTTLVFNIDAMLRLTCDPKYILLFRNFMIESNIPPKPLNYANPDRVW